MRLNLSSAKKFISCCSVPHGFLRNFVPLLYCDVCGAVLVLLALMRVERSLDPVAAQSLVAADELVLGRPPSRCFVVRQTATAENSATVPARFVDFALLTVSTVVGLPPTSLASTANPITVLTTKGPIIL
jgi:hypothetical protein